MGNFRNQINFRDNELSVLILLPFNNFCSCNARLALLWKYRTLWSEKVGANQSWCTCGQVDLVTRTESRTLLLDELLVHIWSTASLDVEHCWKTFVKILIYLSLVVVWCPEKALTCSVLSFNIFIKPGILPLTVFIIMFTTLSGWKHLVSNRDSSTNRKTVNMCWLLIEMCHVSNSHTADTLEFCQRTRRSSVWCTYVN